MAFEDNSAQVIHAIDNAVGSSLDEIGGELKAQVKRNTRVDSSQTKGSWQYVVDEGEKKVTVGARHKMQFGKNSERVNMRFTATVEKVAGVIKTFTENGTGHAERNHQGLCKGRLILEKVQLFAL